MRLCDALDGLNFQKTHMRVHLQSYGFAKQLLEMRNGKLATYR